MRTSYTRSRTIASLAALTLLLSVPGCGGSSSTSVVGPAGAGKCAVSVTNNTSTVPAAGGGGSLTVDTARECSWSARAEASWITVATTSGQGPATVSYSVAPNANGTSRRGSVLVDQHRFEIAQEAAPCSFEATPAAHAVSATGGELSIGLNATNGCAWTARSNAAWITIVSPSEGTGSSTIRVAVTPNTGAARTATVTIGSATVRVDQGAPGTPLPPVPPPPGPTPPPPAPGCTFQVSPTQRTASPAGEEVIINVTGPNSCAWGVVSQATWITVASGATGVGTGTARLVVERNTGAARTGTVSVAGATVTITQPAPGPAPCTYSLVPTGIGVPRDPADITVEVRSGAGCAWTATSQSDWITVVDGRTGTGNGNVRLSVTANSAGVPRTGTVRIGTETFTVQQAASACSYNLRGGTVYDAGRGPDTVIAEVLAPAGCAWTASTTAPWVTIAEGASGSGNGTVRMVVQANTGAPRTATVTIAGIAFTINQHGPDCQNTIDPTSRTLAPAAAELSVAVTTPVPGCTWTATSQAPWITVIEGASGTGNGTVRVAVAANTTTSPRTGTVLIAGRTFTVQQEGIVCQYAIRGDSYEAGRGPDTVTVTVTTDPGCAWTSSSPAPWVTISNGSGTGNGTVTLNVEANSGAPRTATLTIAGLSFRLSQQGPDCRNTIDPVSRDISDSARTLTVDVTTESAGCTWTAVSQDPWIRVTEGGSGAGNGTVRLAVDANTGTSARTGTVIIAGQTFTVRQQRD